MLGIFLLMIFFVLIIKIEYDMNLKKTKRLNEVLSEQLTKEENKNKNLERNKKKCAWACLMIIFCCLRLVLFYKQPIILIHHFNQDTYRRYRENIGYRIIEDTNDTEVYMGYRR